MNGLLFILIILPFIILFESSLSCSGIQCLILHKVDIVSSSIGLSGENNKLNDGLANSISYNTTQNETSHSYEEQVDDPNNKEDKPVEEKEEIKVIHPPESTKPIQFNPIDDAEYQLMAIDNNETYDLNDKTIEQISGNIYGYKLSFTSFLPVNHYSSVVYPNPELKEYLLRYAINNTIIITFIDHGYVDQLVQFYHTSIQGLHITNFIAMVDYPETRKNLEDQYHIPTVVLNHPPYRDGNSLFGSSAYMHKVNMKTLAMIHCLYYGYTVFFSDVDIVFLKNPLSYFDYNYDFNIQMEFYYERFEVNSGFILVQPTFNSMDCLFTAWDIYSIRHVRQQKALNRAILMHKKRGLRVRELNFYEYSNGAVFFDEEYLTTDNKDEFTHVVVIHNNFIVGVPAKEYRFKELMLYNENIDEYYGNQEEKFIWFETNSSIPTDQWYDIILSLAYLGSQLNRTVIMPVVYRTNSPKQLSEMLRRYIQQSTLHHQEFDFAQIKVKYGLNETYEELSKQIQLPEVYYDKVIYSKEEFEKLISKLNNTKSKLNEEEYQKYSSLVQQVKEEKEQLDLFFNRTAEQEKNVKKQLNDYVKKLFRKSTDRCFVNKYVCINQLNKQTILKYKESTFLSNPHIDSVILDSFKTTSTIKLSQLNRNNESELLDSLKQYSSDRFIKLEAFSLGDIQDNSGYLGFKKSFKRGNGRQFYC